MQQLHEEESNHHDVDVSIHGRNVHGCVSRRCLDIQVHSAGGQPLDRVDLTGRRGQVESCPAILIFWTE